MRDVLEYCSATMTCVLALRTHVPEYNYNLVLPFFGEIQFPELFRRVTRAHYILDSYEVMKWVTKRGLEQ